MTTTIKLIFLYAGLNVAAQPQSLPQFTISTVAGDSTVGYSGNGGPATSAELDGAQGVTVDAAGNLYFAEFFNDTIRKVTPGGIITTFAGTGGVAGYSGDGGPATDATLSGPSRALADGAGNLYIADDGNHCVRKVAPDGTITTFAGNGNAGNDGDGGAATSASIDSPGDLALDNEGNLYFGTGTFVSGGAPSVIRKVTAGGIISTIAGNGVAGYSGDGGPAISAMLNTPKGLAFDAAGNLFIADQGNQRIRKISNGIITTVAGNGTAGYAGDGGPAVNAELWSPTGLAFDAAGNLYFADQGNNRIRVLLTDGTIATVAGNGTAAYGGDGGLALDAALNSPKTVAFSGANIYIADTGNERIRLLTPSAQTYVAAVNAASYASSPVATDSIVAAFGQGLASQVASASGSLSTTLAGTSVEITDAGGTSMQADLFYVSPTQVNLLIPATVASGTAQISVTSADGTVSQGQMQIAPVAPGLFTAGNLALGAAIHVDAQGNQTTQELVQYNAIIGQFQPVPINLGASTDSTYLVLYGTGIRNALLSQVTVSLGGTTVTPAYAGSQPSFAGLDQVNLQIPNAMAGAGDVVITLTADAIASNAVHITIQ